MSDQMLTTQTTVVSPTVLTIETTEKLKTFCDRMSNEAFIAVDTEFLRETTYYPKLCLIQIAGAEEAVLIDPLSNGIDLAPFFELMANKKILKVFHAARQDFEILMLLSNHFSRPV